MDIRFFDALASTNQYCELLDLKQTEEFTVVWAGSQTAGVGQQGNRWESAAGENLTFSLVLHPRQLAVADQYRLTKVLSLAVCDWLSEVIGDAYNVRIKWPNDIYVGDKKICGILVSNHIAGNVFDTAVCGIGVNVNQTVFSSAVPNPTSIALLTQRQYDLRPLLESLLRSVALRYTTMAMVEHLDNDYLSRLYRLHEMQPYDFQGTLMRAAIEGVNRFGHLQLRTEQDELLTCAMKELRYIMPHNDV